MTEAKIIMVRNIFILAVVISIIVAMSYHFVRWASRTETLTGKLTEIDDGVYVQTYNVYSNVPANNKTVAIVCIDNQICKIEGKINIFITDDEPSYIWHNTHFVNGDELTVYVPKGTIQQLESTSAP